MHLRWWVVVAYVTLIVSSVCIDTIGGLESYPRVAESDEITAGLEARQSLRMDAPLTWVQHWNMASGYERMAVVPLRVAQLLFGSTVGGGRMAHVFFGVVTVVGLFGFGRRLIGDFPAWCAAILLAVSHVHVHLSRAFVCTGIQSAAAFVLILWILVGLRAPMPARSWVPRAVLAGLVLGWGVQTYSLAWSLPFLVGLTLVGWRRTLATSWWRLAGVMLMAALPLGLPWAVSMVRAGDALRHVAALSSVSTASPLSSFWKPGAMHQLRGAATMWWVGHDECTNYQARIPVLDPVTGVAFAIGLLHAIWHWRSPVTVLVAIWLPALMMGAVGMVNNGVCYYRLSVPLVCVCLVSAWGLTATLSWLLPARLAHGLCLGLLAAAAYANLSYTFIRYPQEARGGDHALALQIVARLCNGQGSAVERQTVADPGYMQNLLRLQCPDVYSRLVTEGKARR